MFEARAGIGRIQAHTPELPQSKREELVVDLLRKGLSAERAGVSVGILASLYDLHGTAHLAAESTGTLLKAMVVRLEGLDAIVSKITEDVNVKAIRAHRKQIEKETEEVRKLNQRHEKMIVLTDNGLPEQDKGHQTKK